MTSEEAVLKKLGLDYQLLDSGCCGMAGAFGFEKDHYDVSIKCGERVLLPAVRNADKDTLTITDGFSCREQITQTTDRDPLHLAQVIQMALHEDGIVPAATEMYDVVTVEERSLAKSRVPMLASAGAIVLGAVMLWRWLQRKQK